jgi:elongation factor Ts
MAIDVSAIKKLRELTGAAISDCRWALSETNGDEKKAVELIRKKGIERAAKKADREVKAGMVFSYIHHTGTIGALVALACETDFVAKTDDFQKLGKELCLQVASNQPENVKELLKQEYVRDPSKTVEELIKETIGKLGENILVADFKIARI